MNDPCPPVTGRPRPTLLGAAGLFLLSAHASAQVWSEEFNTGTAPNPTVWSYDLGAGGWGNNELQTYTNNAANVQVQGGNLVITARPGPGNGFTSARIKTQDKLTFQYGTVEARIKIPDLGNGLWPAFWTLGNDFSTVGWPDCGEIDILEMGSADAIANQVVNRRVNSTAHWEHNGSHAYYGLSRQAPNDLDGSFHLFRLEWTPTAISTFLDGQWIWTMNISNPASFDGHEFHRPHFLILNLAVGGNFPGIWHAGGISAPLPAQYVVDYVRIFDNGHTILGGSGLHPAAASHRAGAGNFNSAYTCGAPVLGSSMTATVVAFGTSYQFVAVLGHLGAAQVPFGAYTILLDQQSPPLLQLPVTALGGGFAQWTVPIPNVPGFAGLPIKTQAVMLGSDIALTNAIDLIVGY